MKEMLKLVIKNCARLGIKPAERVLFVRIDAQDMHFFNAGEFARRFPVSTSMRPPSNTRDSLGTPRGLHEIAERIGDGQPPGMVFKARKPTGRLFSELPADSAPAAPAPAALVTTRILWLRGLEPGVNLGGPVDTHERLIYIHGTNREDLIGLPQTAGCIAMLNSDIIALHDQVRPGDMVLIV